MSRPGFNFRLERVRALREHAEDAAKEELAASLHHRIRGEAMLRSAMEGLDGARSAHRASAGAHVTGADMIARQSYLERSERQKLAAQEDLSRRDAEVAARRENLTLKARERQALERLKDRRRADWVRESARREGAAIDEMAILRHRRPGMAR